MFQLPQWRVIHYFKLVTLIIEMLEISKYEIHEYDESYFTNFDQRTKSSSGSDIDFIL